MSKRQTVGGAFRGKGKAEPTPERPAQEAPAKPATEKKVFFNAQMDESLRREFMVKVKQEGESASDLVRRWIRAYLDGKLK